MTTKQLANELIKLMIDYPNTENDDIEFLTGIDEFHSINKVSIEYDINSPGRCIVIKEM